MLIYPPPMDACVRFIRSGRGQGWRYAVRYAGALLVTVTTVTALTSGGSGGERATAAVNTGFAPPAHSLLMTHSGHVPAVAAVMPDDDDSAECRRLLGLQRHMWTTDAADRIVDSGCAERAYDSGGGRRDLDAAPFVRRRYADIWRRLGKGRISTCRVSTLPPGAHAAAEGVLAEVTAHVADCGGADATELLVLGYRSRRDRDDAATIMTGCPFVEVWGQFLLLIDAAGQGTAKGPLEQSLAALEGASVIDRS